MIKKTILTVVVIVAILEIAFAVYGNNSKNSINTTNSTSPDQVNVTVKNTTSDNISSSQTTITPAEAQKIATTYIAVSGATAGTPKLVNQNGTLVYIVPVTQNNSTVGEIDIDAKTGKNLGGAGGSP